MNVDKEEYEIDVKILLLLMNPYNMYILTLQFTTFRGAGTLVEHTPNLSRHWRGIRVYDGGYTRRLIRRGCATRCKYEAMGQTKNTHTMTACSAYNDVKSFGESYIQRIRMYIDAGCLGQSVKH
ncbi:hypothetical protein V1478_006686 [Vespula squamosa]|uniref:Uncharacterized protein n=1 Tax=Vespula squamosa TaxID=30214 RepID=A0ABD2B8K1_VESSQ